MIRFVVALPAEARPLVRRFGLVRRAAPGHLVWEADGVLLAVSGVGARAAAAAAGCLAGLGDGEPEAAWLNVGIGGHRSLPLGEAVLADRVVDAAAGRAWYPPLVFDPPCPTATVTTVDRPETRYPEDSVYEMEAAGFCAAAARFASAELVQVVKVISDNAGSPPGRLAAGRVEELIDARMEALVAVAEQTAELAGELAGRVAPPAQLGAFVARWRFTLTQRRRLERLLRRLAVVEPGGPQPDELADLGSSRAVLAALEERLAAHPPGIG